MYYVVLLHSLVSPSHKKVECYMSKCVYFFLNSYFEVEPYGKLQK